MAYDVKELINNAQNTLNDMSVEAPEVMTVAPVTPSELAEAVEIAEKSIAQSSELAALKGEESYNVSDFKEVTSMRDIMREKLSEFTDNKDFIDRAMYTLDEKLEMINRVALTREQREFQADLVIGLLKTDREQHAYNNEVREVTRDALLNKRFGTTGAKTMKDSYVGDVRAKFGEKTADKIINSMTPDEFVNAIVAYDTAQRSEYLEWKKNGSVSTVNAGAHRSNDNFLRNNPDVVKSYEQKQRGNELQKQFDSFYNVNVLNKRG
jgi:hypothetical protein